MINLIVFIISVLITIILLLFIYFCKCPTKHNNIVNIDNDNFYNNSKIINTNNDMENTFYDRTPLLISNKNINSYNIK
jgi:hypothetical protein